MNGREWWCTPIIPVFRQQRQHNEAFDISIGNTESSRLAWWLHSETPPQKNKTNETKHRPTDHTTLSCLFIPSVSFHAFHIHKNSQLDKLFPTGQPVLFVM
jgi:hypothetical protein